MSVNQFAVIFDFDGVIVDTEPIYWDAMQKIAKRRGKVVTLELKKRVMGTGGIISMGIMKESLGLSESPKELLEERGKIYRKLLHERGAKPMPGLFNAIDVVNKLKFRRAIASSSRFEWIDFALRELNLVNEFPIIVHIGEVKQGKPAPDVFILALKKLDLPANRCVVLEDTIVGVESAKCAQIKCIAIPNQYNKDMDFSKADIVIETLEEINEKLIKELLSF